MFTVFFNIITHYQFCDLSKINILVKNTFMHTYTTFLSFSCPFSFWFVFPFPNSLLLFLFSTPTDTFLFSPFRSSLLSSPFVTLLNFDNLKLMFNVILVLFDWFGWVEMLCELATCDSLMWMLGYVEFDWPMLKIW